MNAVADETAQRRSRRCRVGMLLGSQRQLADRRALYAAVRAEAEAALTAGVDLLVAAEHLDAQPYRMSRPWPLLAALRADLGGFDAVASVVAGLTSPAQLVADVESVAAVGTGRVGVAVAAGYHRGDFAAADRDYERRWADRSNARRALRGVIDDDLRWSAASTPRSARAAARDGAVWYCPATATSAAITGLALASERAGVARRDVLLSDADAGADARDVGERENRYVTAKYGALRRWGFGAAARTAEVVVGTPGAVAASLVPSSDVHTIVVRLCWPDMEPDVALEHVRRFGQDVLPALRDAAPEAVASVGSR